MRYWSIVRASRYIHSSFSLPRWLTSSTARPRWSVYRPLPSTTAHSHIIQLALKCDLRDDRTILERLQRFSTHPVQYEEGLAVARRIRASRYLGLSAPHPCSPVHCLTSSQNAAQNIIEVSQKSSTKPHVCLWAHDREVQRVDVY